MKDGDRLPEVNLDRPGNVRARCEFCGGTYWIMTEELGVAHSLPQCEDFIADDVLTFLRRNREIKEGKVAKA